MEDVKDMSIDSLLDIDHPERYLERARPFAELMMEYECAMLEVKTKLEVLNAEMSLRNARNPFESIKSRLKKPASIIEKLKRCGYPVSLKSIEENLNDIAGLRVICSFPDDIYSLADSLCAQDDLRLVLKKDYIQNPKENGYRSLHLVLDVPIFLLNQKKYRRVEVQFRTMAMDFWASLEHKVRYKKNVENTEKLNRELKECADMIALADERMMNIRTQLENDNKI